MSTVELCSNYGEEGGWRGRRLDVEPADPLPPRAATGRLAVSAPGVESTARVVRRLVRDLTAARDANGQDAARTGAAVRAQIESFGGFWPRIAALLLAPRLDLFAPEFCAEIDCIAERNAPLDPDVVRETIAHARGRFSHVDEEPVVVNGMGQMHRASLARGDEPVWVAIRGPDARVKLDTDFAVFTRVADGLAAAKRLADFPWHRRLHGIHTALVDSLDFRVQAFSLRARRRSLSRAPGARLPRVFRSMSSENVLVGERIEAPCLADFLAFAVTSPAEAGAWLERNGIDEKRLAHRLFTSFLRQLAEDGNMVPRQSAGEILLLRDSNYCYELDPFGVPLMVETRRSGAVRALVRTLIRRSYGGAFFNLLQLAEPLPPLDPVELQKEVVRDLRAWGQRAGVRTLTPDERSWGGMFRMFFAVARRRDVVIDAEVARAVQILGQLEPAVFALAPRFDVPRELGRYHPRSIRRRALRILRDSDDATPPDLRQLRDVTLELEERLAETAPVTANYSNDVTKGAFLIQSVLELVRFAAGAAIVVLLAVLAAPLRPGASLAQRSLQLGRADGVLLILLAAALFVVTHRAVHRFRIRDSELPTRGVV